MKHIKLYEEFINEASDKKPAILVKLYNELSKAKNKKSLTWGFDGMEEFPHVVQFDNGLESEAHRHEGDMETYSFYLNDDGKTILGIYDLNGYAQELKTPKDAIEWSRANESVNENLNEGTVIDVALGVATGLLGLWAVVQSLPAVGRVLGDAAEAIANKAEAKAKEAAKNQRRELIAEIIKKFDGDARLKQMYNDLPEYSDKTANARKRELTTIGNYIKSKLTPEEMKYFTDISSMLRTGDVR